MAVPDAGRRFIVQAIEQNCAKLLLAMGRAGGGVERADAQVRWSIGGSPIDYHNCVVDADLAEDAADAVIADSLELMRAYGVPGTWHVGPSMRPADLGARLLRQGFREGGADLGMAMELAAAPATVSAPAGLTVERVTNEASLAGFAQVLAQGFGEGEREAAWVAEVYDRMGLAENGPIQHYLGRLGGEPVATATLYITDDVGGLYFISTVPSQRRRGIGAAITLATLHAATRLGCRYAVLGASELGYAVYARLGFRDYCRIVIYEWHPATATLA